MSAKKVKDIAASVRHRLLNKSREEKRSFNELLQYYAMERFLYRLSKSSYVNQFILKGGLMLRVWCSSKARPTIDVDMLGRTDNKQEEIVRQIQDILQVEVEDDGIIFQTDSLISEIITQDAEYKGVRIKFLGILGVARIKMQVDVGFGDSLYPEAKENELPVLLNMPAPHLLCYSRESVVSEKFEAMVQLEKVNSRMKDFYDIWVLSRQFDFDGSLLSDAIARTLEKRGTILKEELLIFTPAFLDLKQAQWKSFHKKMNQAYVPESFEEVVEGIKTFLSPLITSIQSGEKVSTFWDSGKHTWKSKK